MLSNEKFDSQFLFTTQCFDSGTNLFDEDLKNIFIDMDDVDSLIQCLGRKRIKSDTDKVNLYIKTISNQQLGGYQTATKKDISMAQYLLSHDAQSLIMKYPRQCDRGNIIYDDTNYNRQRNQATKKVNMLKFMKKKYDIALYNQMISLGEFGYCKYLARLFGFYDSSTDKYTYEVFNEDYGLMSFLESNLETVWLSHSDRKELINRIDLRRDGKPLKSLNSLNPALEESGIPFKIIEFSTCGHDEKTNTKKYYGHAWKLEKSS